MLEKGSALAVFLFFWAPGLAVAAFSLRGILRLRRHAAAPGSKRPPLFTPSLLFALSFVGVAGALVMLWGYAVGTGLGGYTAPLEEALFSFTFLSPVFLAGFALLASGAWFLTALFKR